MKCYLARSGRGRMLGVVRVPRRDVNPDHSNACFNSHCAHRQLILSPYFPDWAGIGRKNANESPDHVDLCYAYHKTKSLGALVRQHGPMLETRPLCRWLAHHVLMALVDVHEQSTHSVLGRISMEDIRVSSDCTRVYVGGIQWGPELDVSVPRAARSIEQNAVREGMLVSALGDVIHGMITGQRYFPPEKHDMTLGLDLMEEHVLEFSAQMCRNGLRIPPRTRFDIIMPLEDKEGRNITWESLIGKDDVENYCVMKSLRDGSHATRIRGSKYARLHFKSLSKGACTVKLCKVKKKEKFIGRGR